MRNFTHYWHNDTCDAMRAQGSEGELLDHTASNQFLARGIVSGDRIYVVTLRSGLLYLIGRHEVSKIVSMREAQKLLGYDVWDASDHSIAKPKTATPMRFDNPIDPGVTKQLLFESSGKYKTLKFRSASELDGQTLRGVRILNPASASLLEKYLR